MTPLGTDRDWAAHASEQLAGAGYRRGGARAAVIDLLAEQRCARTALEIEEALRHGDRRVARASVYRVLDELERLGVVARFELGHGIARYEAVRPEAGHHHDHLVCDDCGEVMPFHDEDLERALRRAAKRVPFAVQEHEVVLHGHCGACAA